MRDGDDRRDSIRRPPPEAEPYERDSPHWDGRWVGHLYLPSQCGIEDEEEVADDDLETTNRDNDEDDDDSLQNGGASRDDKGDGGDGSSGSNQDEDMDEHTVPQPTEVEGIQGTGSQIIT